MTPFKTVTSSRFFTFLAFALLIVAITWIIYAPGLSGSFIFDDRGNLSPIGNMGGVHNWDTYIRYLSFGFAGPTGRPISLTSFLIDATQWPADAWLFKRTNIVIHIFNSLLVFTLIQQVITLNPRHKIARTHSLNTIFIGFVAASLWAFNPYLVSTTLYIVQRMAQLSAMFTLLGLIAYLYGRLLIRDKPQNAYLIMSLALSIGTLLALLSKENGLLLPLLALTIEFSILSHHPLLKPLNKYWKLLFLYFPASTILVYLSLSWESIIAGYNTRPFSLSNRLLTEPRILWDYLFHLIIPRIQTQGLFFDTFPISINIFQPISTLISITSWVVLIISAFVLRKKYSYFTLAILFFLGAHIIESSIFPLELYFEHRNYLPAIFLFLPLTMGLERLIDKKLFIIISISLIMTLSSITYLRTTLWGKPIELALTWAQSNPQSERAQFVAANELNNLGQKQLAMERLIIASKQLPESISLMLRKLIQRLELNQFNMAEFNETINIIKKNRYDFKISGVLEALVDISIKGHILNYTTTEAKSLIKVLLDNSNSSNNIKASHRLLFLMGKLHITNNQPQLAYQAFMQSLQIYPNSETGLREAAELASAKHFKLALNLLGNVETRILNKQTTGSTVGMLEELTRLRALISTEQSKHLHLQ